MDDVMNFLGSDAGAPFRTRLHAALKADGAQFGGPMESMRRGPRTTLPERIDAYFDYMKFNGELRRRLSDQEIRLLMPSALTCALNFIADDCGRVSVGAALDGAGPHASLLAELFLAMEHGARAFPSTRVGMKFRYLPSGVAERVAKSARPNDVDDRMGAFWKLVDELGSSGALRGWHVVERGHMNASTEALLRALLVSGGDRGSVLGKSYSAHPDVLHRAHALGWSVSEAELQDHTLEADDFRNGISSFIADVATHDRVLMLDDGYEGNSFVQYLMEQRRFRRPDDPMSLVTVEQTERGRSVQRELHANLGIEMKLPVVNMAGSSLKKTYESPAIGEAVAFQIEHDLWEAHPNLSITPKEATILGFGAVGSATAARLRARGYTVFVYDIDPAKMKAAADAGYDVGGFPTGAVPSDPARLETAHAAARDRVLAHGHLLVGCAPCECLKRSEYGKLPQHAVLANAGSGYTTQKRALPRQRGWVLAISRRPTSAASTSMAICGWVSRDLSPTKTSRGLGICSSIPRSASTTTAIAAPSLRGSTFAPAMSRRATETSTASRAIPTAASGWCCAMVASSTFASTSRRSTHKSFG
jgi:S-adenosylhomocysteine hydrolase